MQHKQKKRNGKFMVLVGVFLLLLVPVTKGDKLDALLQKDKESDRIEAEYLEYMESLPDDFYTNQQKDLSRIASIRNDIESELTQFDSSKKISEEAQEKLDALQSQIGTLTGQLMALDISIDVTKKELTAIKMQINKRISDLKFLSEQLDIIEVEMEVQKKTIVSFFRLLQFEDEEFGISDETRNILQILLSDNSFSYNYWEQQQIIALDQIGRKVLHKFEQSQIELTQLKKTVSDENIQLSRLEEQRTKEEERLDQQKYSSSLLKRSAENNQEKFEELLEKAREDMRKSAYTIASLQENKDLLREKMDLLEKQYRQDRLQEAEQRKLKNEQQEIQYSRGDAFLAEDQDEKMFSWPVAPKKGISAFFHDKSYKNYFKMEHNAIDIPTPQGSEVHAPALGYVYEVNDNGMGYSTLILVHRNNFMTVYGHVSGFLVKEGQLVREGDAIALSGGMPGTKGAGLMTTGPHLHFEVFKDGEHVDPLLYLPELKTQINKTKTH